MITGRLNAMPIGEKVEPVVKYLRRWAEKKAADYGVPRSAVDEALRQANQQYRYYPIWELYIAYAVLKKPVLTEEEKSVARIVFNHGERSVRMLRQKNINYSDELEEIEFLISHHHDYSLLDDKLDGMVQSLEKTQKRADELRLLASIMIVSDIFEKGNNYDRMAGRPSTESFPETFEGWMKKRFEDMEDIKEVRPREALKRLIGRRDAALFAILTSGRKSSALSADDVRFIEQCKDVKLPLVRVGVVDKSRPIWRDLWEDLGKDGLTPFVDRISDAALFVSRVRQANMFPALVDVSAIEASNLNVKSIRKAIDLAMANANIVCGIYVAVSDKLFWIERRLDELKNSAPTERHDHFTAEKMAYLLFSHYIESVIYRQVPMQDVEVSIIRDMFEKLQANNAKQSVIVKQLANNLWTARTDPRALTPLPDDTEVYKRLEFLSQAGISITDPGIADLLSLPSARLETELERRRDEKLRMAVSGIEESPIRVVFFDWDGTLLETSHITIEAFSEVCKQLIGMTKKESMSFYRDLDGKTMPEQFAMLSDEARKRGMPLSITADEYAEQFNSTKTRILKETFGSFLPLVRGALEFIVQLKASGVRVYVVSGTMSDALKEQLDKIGLTKMIDGMYGSPSSDEQKISQAPNKAEYMNKVLADLGVQPGSALMFGDAKQDIASANAVGIRTVGVVMGNFRKNELEDAGAVMVIQDYQDGIKLKVSLELLISDKLIVGIHQDAGKDVEDAVRSVLGKDAHVVRGIAEVNSICELKKTAGIFIDNTVTAEMIKSGDLKGCAERIKDIRFFREHPVLLTLNASTVKDKTRAELLKILDLIVANLEKMKKADVDDALKADARRQNTDLAERARQLIEARRAELSAAYNNAPLPDENCGGKVAIATSETVAENDPYLVENMEKAAQRGIVNCFIYGKIFSTQETARSFLAAAGFRGDMEKIVFVDMKEYPTYESLNAEIQKKTGILSANIGIRATAADRIGRPASKEVLELKVLEIAPVTINNKDYYVAINTYQAILRFVTGFDKGIGFESVIPGLSAKDGILVYLPRSIPIDYDREIDAYRRAIEILLMAA
jgi:phosphoglycolate phosphatase